MEAKAGEKCIKQTEQAAAMATACEVRYFIFCSSSYASIKG